MENDFDLVAPRSAGSDLVSEVKTSAKPKLKPSVTPRTFRRFFAPRGGSRAASSGTNRKALQELASPAVNGRDGAPYLAVSTLPKYNTPLTSPTTSFWEHTRSSPVYSQSAERTPPSKRRKICQDESHNEFEDSEEDNSILNHPPSRPIQRSRFRSSLGDCLRRQLSLTASPLVKASFSTNSHYDTSDFYSGPEDVFICKDISDGRSTTPFCSAACNTNSLVAVGDAEGVVQILETTSNSTQTFKQPLLTIRAHNNALLDLQFSSDDKLLATASGDQACQIIDMFTQKALYSLNGHISSVRQVKFQPGSSNSVVATSSRDGSIQIWDLRCSTRSNPASHVACHLQGPEEDLVTTRNPSLVYGTSINRIDVAGYYSSQSSQLSIPVPGKNTDRRARPMQQRNTSSVTSLSFLSANNPHILISGNDAEAAVKVWDIRMQQKHNQQTVPLSTSTPPIHHNRYRHFGLTSIALSADASRLYTLCKDNTVYVYSSSHLILGSTPDLCSPIVKPWRREPEQKGAAPIYAFRHERMKISSFYVKLAIRPAQDDKIELLAIGSSDNCALLFSTDERSFTKRTIEQSTDSTALSKTCRDIDSAQMPIYRHGTPLTRGHDKEVTNVSWTSEGNLVSLGDDSTCRVWRSDGAEASRLRKCGEQEGKRWGHGWAHVDDEWDEDSDRDGRFTRYTGCITPLNLQTRL